MMTKVANDKVIPFTVSRAILIEQTATRVSMLMWMMSGLLALGVTGLAWILMHP